MSQPEPRRSSDWGQSTVPFAVKQPDSPTRVQKWYEVAKIAHCSKYLYEESCLLWN